MTRMFGTDGVRGIANQELTPELAFQIGRAAVVALSDSDRAIRKKILIGRDTRLSGEMLEAALSAGIMSQGADALLAGIIPTPGIAYLVQKYHCHAGVVISASHNPYEFNGIKLFSKEGYKLPDEIEDEIEAEIRKTPTPSIRPVGDQIGRCYPCPQAQEHYLERLSSFLPKDLSGYRIALDCAHGASYEIAPALFRMSGAEILELNNRPDGININQEAGSTHPEILAQYVRDNHCDLGLAFDGDADRLIAVDDQGEVVDGDVTMAILALQMKRKGTLKEDTLVGTVMSNLGLSKMAEENGLHLVKTKVGDRYVLEEMLKNGYVIGGEQSGHMIFLQEETTGDGLLTGIHLLQAIQESQQKLSQLRRVITLYPQVTVNASVPNEVKQKAAEDEAVQKASEKIRKKLGEKGRLLLRPSGTEPYVRITIEGQNLEEIQQMAQDLSRVITSRFSY